MGIIGKLFGRSSGEQETYQYKCNTCHSRFDSNEPDAAVVACDACGSNDVKRVPTA